MVVEILEDIPADREVIAACQRLKDAGYTLALDDVVSLEPYGELLGMADVLKVDFRAMSPDARRVMAKKVMGTSVRLLAEKVETYDEFRQAVDEGFALFQGYFFAKPEVIQKRDVPGNKAQYLRLLHEIRKPHVTMDGLERIIKQDMSLSYRLLKYINSPLFGLRSEIRSVRHALTLLGERDVRRWAMLAAMTGMAPEKPSELLETGLLRARFCETLSAVLGPAARDAAEEMFLVGLFSVLDALLDVPLEEAARDAGFPPRVKAALLGVPSPLRNVLELVFAYERGDWDIVGVLLDELKVDQRAVAQVFVDSVELCAPRNPRTNRRSLVVAAPADPEDVSAQARILAGSNATTSFAQMLELLAALEACSKTAMASRRRWVPELLLTTGPSCSARANMFVSRVAVKNTTFATRH